MYGVLCDGPTMKLAWARVTKMAPCVALVAPRSRSQLLYAIINNVHSDSKDKSQQTNIILYYYKR